MADSNAIINKMAQPSPSLCLSFLVISIYNFNDQSKPIFKCRIADSAVYISPLSDYLVVSVSSFNCICINNPASFIQSLFFTPQSKLKQNGPS